MSKDKDKKIETIGSDPEVFIYDLENKEYISGEGIVNGNKEAPFYPNNGDIGIQKDNVMVEFNIPPSTTADDFSKNLQKGLDLIKNIIGNNIEIRIESHAVFPEKLIGTKQFEEFGCSDDFDAYSLDFATVHEIKTTDRFCGGHVHLGFEKPTEDEILNTVRAMDLYLAIPMMIFEGKSLRSQYYGTPGRFRIKPYGLEYRTLSNYWLKTDKLRKFVFDQSVLAFENRNSLDEMTNLKIQNCILNFDLNTAENLCNEFELINVIKNKKEYVG